MLLDKLAFTENKYEELSVKISDPSIMANQKEWRKLCKEHADLEVIVTAYREYKKVVEDLEANKEMLEEETDKEMREMLSEEISSLKAQEEELENKIQILYRHPSALRLRHWNNLSLPYPSGMMPYCLMLYL